MISAQSNLERIQSDAAIEANDAFSAGMECLPSLSELAADKSQNEIMLALGFMIAYQLSIEAQRITQYLDEVSEHLKDIVDVKVGERIAPAPIFWMTSDEAAKDKAKEINLDILPEWTMADLRYKLHQVMYGGEHG
jgi:hypothetical protein